MQMCRSCSAQTVNISIWSGAQVIGLCPLPFAPYLSSFRALPITGETGCKAQTLPRSVKACASLTELNKAE